MIKNNKQPKLLNNKNNKNILECKISKQPHHIERINAWTCYNAYA